MTAGYDYPSDADLDRLRAWDLADPIGFLKAAQALWWIPDRHWPDEVVAGATFEVHTGGWSGNELVIEAMQAAHGGLLWHYVWEQTRRGGHYTFTARAVT